LEVKRIVFERISFVVMHLMVEKVLPAEMDVSFMTNSSSRSNLACTRESSSRGVYTSLGKPHRPSE
jgi:hypothetical protein